LANGVVKLLIGKEMSHTTSISDSNREKEFRKDGFRVEQVKVSSRTLREGCGLRKMQKQMSCGKSLPPQS
jgi:hypothetical protein